MYYLTSFLKRKSSMELMGLYHNVNNPVKEITESWAAYKHMVPFLDLNDPNVCNLHIGDGAHCMTGAMFAFNTKNYNMSIDPIINMDHMAEWDRMVHPKHFGYHKARWQDIKPMLTDISERFFQVNVICVHAHVDLKELSKVVDWEFCYTNPCCNYDEQTLDLGYQKDNLIEVRKYGKDNHILSEKNNVIIYQRKRP